MFNQMRLQNIIDVVSLSDLGMSDAAVNENIRRLHTGSHAAVANVKTQAIVDELVASVLSNKLTLLELQPVFGAHMLVLAESISCSPVGQNARGSAECGE